PRVDEILEAWLHEQAGPDRASVIQLHGHFPALYADAGGSQRLNLLGAAEVAAIRAIGHAEAGKVAWPTRQEPVGDQTGVEEVGRPVAALVRRACECPKHAQVPLLRRVAPAQDRLIPYDVEPVAGLQGLPWPAEDLGPATVEVGPELRVAGQAGSVRAVV